MKICDQANIKLNSASKSTQNSMAPLTWLLHIFALNCDTSPFTLIKSFFTALVLGALTFYSLYYKINNIYESIVVSIKLTDAVQMIYDYCQYIVDLYFVYKYGRHIHLVYFKHYESIDKILGMTDCSEIQWKLMKLLGLLTLIWSISSSCDFAAWVLSYGWIVPIVYSVSYIFLFIKILTILNLAGHVMLIEVRLNIIGDMLENCYISTGGSTELVTDCLSNRNWLYSSICTGVPTKPRPLQPEYHNDHHEVRSLIRCYLLLTEQVAFINSMYGFRILLNSLSLLIDMVRFTNLAVRIASGSQQTPHKSGYFPAVSSLMRLFTCIAMEMSLVEQCERTYRQKERIINITDHLLINKEPSERLRQVITELRSLVQERPISFNMANVFDINYSWLVSVASVVVTYTIILLQSMN